MRNALGLSRTDPHFDGKLGAQYQHLEKVRETQGNCKIPVKPLSFGN